MRPLPMSSPQAAARWLLLAGVLFGACFAFARPGYAAQAPSPSSTPDALPALGGPTQFWFAPLPPRDGNTGAQDFQSLFARNARWTKASNKLDTFKFYQGWVLEASDAQLKAAVSELKRRGLAIAVETAPLSTAEGCGQAVEGFDGDPIHATKSVIARIVAAGGTVSTIAFSEPVSFGTNTYTGPNACNWTVDQVADRIATYLHGVLATYPGLTYGDIESDHADIALVDTFLAAMRVRGYPMAFLHWDVDWESEVRWVELAAEMAAKANARGVRFGMIYYGRPSDATGAAWLGSARQHAAMFETLTTVRPDDVIFQSFHPLPRFALPETSSSAMTSLVLKYFLRRTALSLSLALNADGNLIASGALRRPPASILGNRPVVAVARALDGPGEIHEYRIDSVVPSNASSALIGLRINTECSCAGNAYVELLDVQYIQQGVPVPIPNSGFDFGLDYWGVWGTGASAVAQASGAPDNALYLNVSSSQFAGVNSTPFPVQPGARFTVIFRARVLPSSEGSGYFSILFPSPTGDHRKNVQLSGVEQVVSSRTDGRGNYSIAIPPLTGTSTYRVTVRFPGDTIFWPAYARREGP